MCVLVCVIVCVIVLAEERKRELEAKGHSHSLTLTHTHTHTHTHTRTHKPYPANLETARSVEQCIRSEGAVPATVAILNGRVAVGLSDSELTLLAESVLNTGAAAKV